MVTNMEQESQFISMVSSVDPHSLPLVVVIIAIAYLYFKFHKVETDRSETKLQRDTDSQNLHDDVLKLKFDVSNLNGFDRSSPYYGGVRLLNVLSEVYGNVAGINL